MRHYTQYRTEEYLIVGHNPTRNDCMVVRMAAIPADDAIELRKLANSPGGQAALYMTDILRSAPHRTGHDWFTHLAHLLARRNGGVVTLPLKEIQDHMDPDQRAAFKGYGQRPMTSQTGQVVNESLFGVPPAAQHQRAEESMATTTSDIAYAAGGAELGRAPAAPAGIDYKVDMLAQTIVEESRATQKLLAALIERLPVPAAPAGLDSEETAPKAGGRGKK